MIKQILGTLLEHVIICFFTVIVMPLVFGWLADYVVAKSVAGTILVIVYAYLMFKNGYDYSVKDLKFYSELKPFKTKGLVLSTGVVVPVVLSWIWYGLAWAFAPVTEAGAPASTICANLVYSFLTSPFWTFINIKGGTAHLAGQLMAVGVPAAFSFLGYFCGYKKWDYTIIFKKIVFEKSKKE